MVAWSLRYTRQAQEDAERIASAGLKKKAEELLEVLINIHHRLIYQVYKIKKTVKVIRMWTHYE